MKRLFLILLLLSAAFSSSAQTRNVTGRVTEPDGTPMIGAVVEIVGTFTAVTTSVDGTYLLKNVPAEIGRAHV